LNTYYVESLDILKFLYGSKVLATNAQIIIIRAFVAILMRELNKTYMNIYYVDSLYFLIFLIWFKVFSHNAQVIFIRASTAVLII
jgi:hypothetical protein